MTAVIDEIYEERVRQVHGEGWSPAHDDGHDKGELAMAAACYAASETLYVEQSYHDRTVFRDLWPWSVEWDKRRKHTRRRRMVIAAALIVAEIERLDRAAAKENSHGQ